MRDVRELETAGLRVAVYVSYPAAVVGLAWSAGSAAWPWVGWLLAVLGVIGAGVYVLADQAESSPPPPPRADLGQQAADSYTRPTSVPNFAPNLDPPGARRRFDTQFDDD